MIFRDFYYSLQKHLGQHPKLKQKKFKIKSKIFLLDSTTITLCLSVFNWAKYKTTKGAIKLHTLLDYDGDMPIYVNITDGKTADNRGAIDLPLVAGSVIVADRFYNDFNLLNVWDSSKVFFVVRHKNNLQYTTVKELDLPQKEHQNILKDEIVVLKNEKYTRKLRRVAIWNEDKKCVIELITNNFKWSAETIGELYKSRWQIEIFFREIKQLLQIKSFIGTSFNAVMIQVWSALITILVLKYLRAISKYSWHLSNLVAFIRINIFVKIDLQTWLDNPFLKQNEASKLQQQGIIFQNY